MNRKAAVLAVVLSGLVIAGGAMAMSFGKDGVRHRGHPPSAEELFKRFDANQDGKITQEELEQFGQNRFAEHDTDNDGLISRDEAKAAMLDRLETKVDRMFERLDKDDDGFISAEERPDRREKMAKIMMIRLDDNEDGAISLEEAKAAEARRKEHHKKPGWH